MGSWRLLLGLQVPTQPCPCSPLAVRCGGVCSGLRAAQLQNPGRLGPGLGGAWKQGRAAQRPPAAPHVCRVMASRARGQREHRRHRAVPARQPRAGVDSRCPGRGPPARSFPPRGAPGPRRLSVGTELEDGSGGRTGDRFHFASTPRPLSEALSPYEPACGQFLSPQTQVRPRAWRRPGWTLSALCMRSGGPLTISRFSWVTNFSLFSIRRNEWDRPSFFRVRRLFLSSNGLY